MSISRISTLKYLMKSLDKFLKSLGQLIALSLREMKKVYLQALDSLISSIMKMHLQQLKLLMARRSEIKQLLVVVL